MDALRISCELCGTYELPQTARLLVDSCPKELRPFLTANTRQNWELYGRIVRIEDNWVELAESDRHTSVHQRAEKLLRAIERRTPQPGAVVTLRPEIDYPLVDALDSKGLHYFVDHLSALDYVDKFEPRNVGETGLKVRLTVKGWDRLDPASGGAGIPGRVFVAMSFDPSLDEPYQKGIRAAIEDDCKMNAIRVDKVHHNEKICDRIIAEIRRAQVVVADFTNHRAGVYFEAGFALALGRLVIWTCRSDAIKDAHFDTRQYPHLVWHDSADLRTKLSERIQALLGH
jgi:hypothetical protein